MDNIVEKTTKEMLSSSAVRYMDALKLHQGEMSKNYKEYEAYFVSILNFIQSTKFLCEEKTLQEEFEKRLTNSKQRIEQQLELFEKEEPKAKVTHSKAVSDGNTKIKQDRQVYANFLTHPSKKNLEKVEAISEQRKKEIQKAQMEQNSKTHQVPPGLATVK